MRRLLSLALVTVLLAPTASSQPLELGEPVVLQGAAVAETSEGLVGFTATFTVTAATNGSGHIFLDTFPLTQVDMQGSARLAARVAAHLTGKDLSRHDLFFVIRSNSVQIGGPSAGATLAVGAIAALNGWKVRPDVLMTGTIMPDGSVGPVGGIPEKAGAAARAGMRTFLFPAGEETAPLSAEGNRPVDVAAYCRAELKIECRPVNDVIEAVENMTDHAFVRPPIADDVTGEDFRARLGPLSGELLTAARERVGEAATEVGQVPPGGARTALEDRLRNAQETLARAESAAANGTYYTASSLSFQASIAGRDTRDRARLTRGDVTMDGILDEAEAVVERARIDVGRADVSDTSAFEFVGAAQVRLVDAEERMGRARLVASADASEGIAEASFAAERAETARWWLLLGEDLEPGEPVDADGLEEAARDTITTSLEVVAYVAAVLAGSPIGDALDPARERLTAAEAAMGRGFHAGAMLYAMEAQVRASDVLLLASFGADVPEAKLEAARVAAARAIQSARERGVEPVLAQSEYEFALSIENDAERLSFLGLARVTANLAGLPGVFGAAQNALASRFQGLPVAPSVPASWIAASFAVGLALGAGLGFTAMMPRASRR